MEVGSWVMYLVKSFGHLVICLYMLLALSFNHPDSDSIPWFFSKYASVI